MIAYWEPGLEWMGEGLQIAICPSFTGQTGLAALDLSGCNNHGTLTNMDRNTAWTTSGGKGALAFDGSNDRVELGRAMSFSTTSFSFSIWANQNTAGIGMPIGDRTSTTSYVWFRSGNYVRFNTPGGSVEFSGVTTFTGMNHAVLTGSVSSNPALSTIDLFWNGTKQTSLLLANSTFVLNTMGDGYASQSFPFPGRIDDVRIYNRALTATEIRQMYERDRGGGMLHQPPTRRSYYAQLAAAFAILAESGSYALTGQPIPLLYGRALSADTGSVLLSGQTTPLLTSRLLNANQGSYAYTGTDAATLLGRLLDAGAAAYTLDGTAAGFIASRRISADTVAYLASGLDTGFLSTRVLEAGTGQYVLVASPVNLETGTPGTGGAAPYYYLFLLGGSR